MSCEREKNVHVCVGQFTFFVFSSSSIIIISCYKGLYIWPVVFTFTEIHATGWGIVLSFSFCLKIVSISINKAMYYEYKYCTFNCTGVHNKLVDTLLQTAITTSPPMTVTGSL